MGSYKAVLESLSGSLELSWRSGALLEWMMKGISGEIAKGEDVEDVLGRATSILQGYFPPEILKGDESESREIRFLRTTLFMAYFASVKHDWMPIKEALLSLKLQDQRSIERIFCAILEEKWSDPLLKDGLELEVLEASRPLPCPTTPINRFKRMKTRASPSSFHFSPCSPSQFPLKDFFTSPVTAQISKYQKIAEEKTKLLRATRLELDYEKVETFNLAREREDWLKERKNLRKSLEFVRSNLYSSQWEEEDQQDSMDSSYDNLQRRLAERKDEDTYSSSLEDQLRESLDERNEQMGKIESLSERLKETSILNSMLESRVIELQASLSLEKDLSKDLIARCEDFELQVIELREILNSRGGTAGDNSSSDHCPNAFRSSWSVFPSASIGDISMDEPLMPVGSPSCFFPPGENMADTFVIPELEEKLSHAHEEVEKYLSKTANLEEELSKSRMELEVKTQHCKESHSSLEGTLKSIKDDNSALLSTMETLKSDNMELETSLKERLEELESLRCDLSQRNDELKSNQSEFRAKLENKENEIRESTSQMRSLSNTMDELKRNLNREIMDNRTLRKSLAALRDQKAESFKTKLHELEVKVEELHEEKKRDQNQLNAEIEELKNKLKAESESFQSQIYESNRKLKMKADELSEIKNKLSSLLDAKFSIAFENQKPSSSNSKPELSRFLNVLENENIQLKEELSSMKDEHREILDKTVYREGRETLGEIFGNEMSKLRSEMDTKTQELLADQKARYQSRMSVIADEITKKYQNRFDDLLKIKNAEIEAAKKSGIPSNSENLTKKLESVNIEMNDLKRQFKDKSSEFSTLLKKYHATKGFVLKLNQEKQALLKKLEASSHSCNHSLEIEQLKLQLRKLKVHNNSLSTQLSKAESDIKNTNKKILSEKTNCSLFGGGLQSSMKESPRRPKRNHSDVSQRAPLGVHFDIQDEDGENFSTSYRLSSEETKLNLTTFEDEDDNKRLSELMRRNVLQPAHLRSSYPAETQFYGTDSFKETDLLEGKRTEGKPSTLSTTMSHLDPPMPKSLNRSIRPHSIIGLCDSRDSSSSPRSRKRQNTSSSLALPSSKIYLRDNESCTPPPK